LRQQPALFLDQEPLRLAGGRDRESGRIVFPDPGTDGFDPIALSPTGTLWSYTVQRFRPKTPPYAGPADFTPWAIGYVALAGEVIVQARLVDVAFEAIRIGMKLALTRAPLDPDAAIPIWLPAFGPVQEHAA
jgi:uncharacterized protein